MNCGKCGGEMKTVTLVGGPGYPPYLSYKKKGLFESEKRSPVDCRVCVQCGAAVCPESGGFPRYLRMAGEYP